LAGGLCVNRLHDHSDTPHSDGFVWTSDQPHIKTSPFQHNTNHQREREREREREGEGEREGSIPRRDSNPQSQQATGPTPTP